MPKSDNYTLNSALVYFQFADPSCVSGLDTGDLVMRLEDGGAWNDSDRTAGRIRTEGRFYSTYPMGQWSTFAMTVERRADEFPVFGSARPDKVTFLQFFNDGKSRPSFWLETLGEVTSIFLNSGVDKSASGAIALDVPLHGTVRWVQEVRPHADGTLDIRLLVVVDGEGRVVFERMGFAAEAPGGLKDCHGKWGLYMSKGAGRAVSGSPTLTSRVSGLTIHAGEAVAADYTGAGFPFIPRPDLDREDAAPLAVVTPPADPVEPPPVVTPPEPAAKVLRIKGTFMGAPLDVTVTGL